jgi:hypothetical protein
MRDATMNVPIRAALLSAGLCLALAVSPPMHAADDEAACLAALVALAGPSADTREHAARQLYERCDRAILDRDPAAASVLAKAVERGSGAAAILLLGYFRDAESRRVLRAVPSTKPVKLHLSSVPVPAPLVAAAALAHAGEPGPLESAVRTQVLAEREFLLDVLGELEPGPAMRTLAESALGDEREVMGGAPSGVQPRRRLCDAAVDAFAARLKPTLSFPLTPARRYAPEQLAEARAVIRQHLAQ